MEYLKPSKPFRSVHRCYKSRYSRHNIVQTFHPEQIIQLTSNMLVSGHDLIQALEASYNLLCLRHHLSADKTMVLSDLLQIASEGQRQTAQRSFMLRGCTSIKPRTNLSRFWRRSATCLSLHAIGTQQVWLQLHICYCIAQHQVTIQASTIACHDSGEEQNAWLTCSALATPRRVTSCFVTSTCLYASGSARLSCNPLSLQVLAAALLAA